jgi:pimeloyl-ACP methyl ester carboxylesterase
MFEPLLSRLSGRFGHSDAPDTKQFAYTFDHIASVITHFTEALGLSHYVLSMQDYGGPVGFRMVLAHPERVRALIVQNAVAHNTGLGPTWKVRRAFWENRSANEQALHANLLSLETTRARKPTFKPISSTIIGPTLRRTRPGKRGFAKNSLGCLWCGARRGGSHSRRGSLRARYRRGRDRIVHRGIREVNAETRDHSYRSA